MALSFNQSKGSAQKTEINTYTFENGENTLRIVGDILARYVYWIEGENKKNIPLECLSFSREEERFTNEEKDWIKTFHPDLKCSWSYATQCIQDGEIKVVNLKKKLWGEIISAAEDKDAKLGDPTDYKLGWDIKFTRAKTGPLPYNVEYKLLPFKCKVRALSTQDLEVLKDLKSMDVIMPRPTPDAQKTLLDRLRSSSEKKETAIEIDGENIEKEFDIK